MDGWAGNEHQIHRSPKVVLMHPETLPEQAPGTVAEHSGP